ncbi:aspartyl protease family protein [Sphingomonas sp. RS2018]
MRFVLLALLSILVAAPATAAPETTTLAADTEARWVSFDLTPGNQIRFTMHVNGRPATAILDTGVSYTVVSRVFADALGLKPVASGKAMAVGGSVPLGLASVESVRVGGLTRIGGRLAVADLTAVVTGTATPVEVLVGADLLGVHALDIDYDKRRFRLIRSGRLPFRGTAVPLAIARDSGVLISEVTLGGRRLRPMIVDTGDGSMVTVSQEAWASVTLPALRETSAYAFGLAGPLETTLAVVPALRIGTLLARNIEVRVEGEKGFSAATGTAGRIGSGLLQRYRVLLDPRARRMFLTPGKTVDAVPLKSTSGLLVGLEKTRLRVLHVMRGSPASAANWKAGEHICRIDGKPLPSDYLTNSIALWPAGRPGRVVTLGLCDGTDRTLTLADFY